MAARLTLQNDPPPNRLLKGAAMIVGFDLLAVVTAVMWWRACVVFDHAGFGIGTSSASALFASRRSRRTSSSPSSLPSASRASSAAERKGAQTQAVDLS